MSNDVLENALSDLENGAGSSPKDKPSKEPASDKSEDKENSDGNDTEKPKKNLLGAAIVVVGLMVYGAYNFIGGDDSSPQPSDTEGPVTIEEPTSDGYETISESQSDDILDSLLGEVPVSEFETEDTEVPVTPETDVTKVSIDQPEPDAKEWSEVTKPTPVPDWNNNLGITQDDLDLTLTAYVNKQGYESDRTTLEQTVESQSIQIRELKASIGELASQLAAYEKMMESVELDIMLNKDRPKLNDVVIIQPRIDCDECNSKASFIWEGIETTVAPNSIFMGFKVIISGDILKLVAGSVEHVYSPEV